MGSRFDCSDNFIIFAKTKKKIMLEFFKSKINLFNKRKENNPFNNGWRQGLNDGLGHLESFQKRIEELKKYYIHISIVSDGFKLDPERKFDSSFRGVIHYLDKNNEWTFTDTSTYNNIFECIEVTIEVAEYIKSEWI